MTVGISSGLDKVADTKTVCPNLLIILAVISKLAEAKASSKYVIKVSGKLESKV
jgi:hypothetical protein